MMKLWLVKRTDSIGYDEYDSMVVSATTAAEARTYHPNGSVKAHKVEGYWRYRYLDTNLRAGFSIAATWDCWSRIEDLEVSYLGTTDREIEGVVLASFNAG